jgi:tetratricopeptide (TPR) repeat protein
MEIQRLKKRLLKEELRIRRRRSKKFRLQVGASLLLLILLLVGGIRYTPDQDKILEGDFARAEALVEKEEYEEAVALFQSIYERRPGFHRSPQALFLSGEVLNLFLKRYHEALIAYLRVIKDYPGSDIARRARFQEADIYKNRLRDFDRAVIAYQTLLDQEEEESDRLHYELADSYFRLENFEQARIEFEVMMRDHPESPLLPEVKYRIGAVWSLEGDLLKAEEVFRRTMERWPDDSYGIEAAFSLAAVLEERGELHASLEILENLTPIYPNSEILEKKTDQVRERIRKKKGI